MIVGLSVIFSMLIFIISAIIIYTIIKFILYIFQSFGVLNIAKKENYKYPYTVWIPFVSEYFLGKFCMDNKKGILYAVLTLIKAILTICIIYIESTSLLYIWLIYIVVYFIIDMLVMNKFYKKVYKNSEIFTVFTIITFGLLKPIFIYTIRIKKISKYQ